MKSKMSSFRFLSALQLFNYQQYGLSFQLNLLFFLNIVNYGGVVQISTAHEQQRLIMGKRGGGRIELRPATVQISTGQFGKSRKSTTTYSSWCAVRTVFLVPMRRMGTPLGLRRRPERIMKC